MTNTQLISELLLESVMNKITYSPNFLYLKLVLLRFRVVCCIINYILLIMNPISLHWGWLLNWGMNWTQVILFFFFFFFLGKLTRSPNGSWTHNLALYPVIMGGKSAKLSYSSLARLFSFTYMIQKISYGCYLHELEMVLMMFAGWFGFKILISAYTLVFLTFYPFLTML